MAEEQTIITPEIRVDQEIGKAIAETLTKQHNPLEDGPKLESFVAEPFFKEEQPEVEVEATMPDNEIVKPGLEEKEAVKEPVIETKIEEQTEAVVEQIPEPEFVALLNTAINDPEISFKSLEDVKALVSENKKLKEATEFQTLSQEERARIEVGREFGDFGLFDRVMGIATDKLGHKEALKHVYFLDNIGKNPQFLEKAFEKEFAKTYEEDPDEEFSKMLLEDKGQEAIKKLIDLQEDLKSRGQVSGSAKPETTEEDRKKEDEKWFAAVDSVMEKNDRITYSLDEGLEINIVMDANDKTMIQEAMDRPAAFLKSLITDEKGNYDHAALYEFIMRNVYFEKVLEEARKSGAAHQYEKILKDKKNTVIESIKAGDAGVETKLSDQIAGNFRNIISNR